MMKKKMEITPTMLEYERVETKQNTTENLIKDLEQIITNLKYGWKCNEYTIRKTDSHNQSKTHILETEYKIEFKLYPTMELNDNIQKWRNQKNGD